MVEFSQLDMENTALVSRATQWLLPYLDNQITLCCKWKWKRVPVCHAATQIFACFASMLAKSAHIISIDKSS